MTGFGQANARNDLVEVTAEIKSVNNRFMESTVKLPRSLSGYENDVKDIISKRVHRGRVMVWITIEHGSENLSSPILNKSLARSYIQLGHELKKELSIKGDLDLFQILNMPDVIAFQEKKEEIHPVWDCTQKALNNALDKLIDMRRSEGRELEKDLRHRIANIQKRITQIKAAARNAPEEEYDKLEQRIQSLLNGKELDKERLEMEVALIADKIDITEECVRFGSHNRLFLKAIEAKQPEGRKLNFLLQEMHREANTIGAKTNSAQIAHLVIEIKENIEQLREQVQNIE